MQYNHYTVNDFGLKAIHEMLSQRHKLGYDHFTPEMLNAWARQAEDSLMEGNGPEIELKSWETLSGHTETWRVPQEGLDCEVRKIDD